MQAGYVQVDTETLARIRDDFAKNGQARVRVGVLGGHTARMPVEGEDGDATNATIGAVHEFGSVSKKLPMRSWLRMPILSALPEALLKTDRQLWGRTIIKLGIRGALGLLGAYALDVVHLAFESGGFGLWPRLKPYTIRKKKSSAILIDSAQLRQAVTAEIFDK